MRYKNATVAMIWMSNSPVMKQARGGRGIQDYLLPRQIEDEKEIRGGTQWENRWKEKDCGEQVIPIGQRSKCKWMSSRSGAYGQSLLYTSVILAHVN